ncbi:hypothetical protein H2204_008952 [Knufia peltigerae]|uniref:Piwi-domain-containing protein n=1 Tax=Knufia peltigerae TaxID=1002370 RepID=A0AA39CVE9_9EURO|nr:hypothetical protein H2204_008952 [Knufia peltigerae]
MSSGRGRASRGRGGGSGRDGQWGRPARPVQPNPSLGPRPGSSKAAEDMRVRQVEDDTQAALESVKTTNASTLPLRPGYGTKGKPTLVWTNHFELKGLVDLTVYRYAVGVAPDRNGRTPGKMKQRQIIHLLIDDHFVDQKPNIATDFFSNMISNIPLELQNPYPVRYRDEGDDVQDDAMVYQVSVQPTGVMRFSDLLNYVTSTSAAAVLDSKEELIHVLNIILGHYPRSSPRIVSVGSKRYFSLDRNSGAFAARSLGAGLNAMRGLFTSARAATARILINAQISHCTFYEAGPLENLIFNYQEVNGPNKAKLEAFLKKVTVYATHLKKRKGPGRQVFRMRQIQAFASPRDGEGQPHRPHVTEYGAGPKDVKFWLDSENSYISVFDFFKKEYNIVIKHTHLPVINVGNRQRLVYLPAQVCHVRDGQSASMKLSPIQTSNMIGFAVKTPGENQDWIAARGAGLVGFAPANQTLDTFGLKINPELISVPARILDGPKVVYTGNNSVKPSFASWNLRNVRFSAPMPLKRWTFLRIGIAGRPVPWGGQGKFKQAIEQFMSKMEELGITVERPFDGIEISVTPDTTRDKIRGAIDQFMHSERLPPPNFLLVCLSRKDTAIYNQVKYTCDVLEGVLNICVAEKFFSERNEQYLANVCLKLNLKLGGHNHCLEGNKLGIIADGKTMLVGLDVTHPSPGSVRNAPSVAAVVASVDRSLSQFPAELLMLPSRQEMITGLKELVKTRLVLWQKNNRSLPDNILVYRDGVSEGQYSQVLEQEVPLFREASKELYPADRIKEGFPRICVIVVGKRHHTRFYPTRSEDADRMMNPKNGTVVDRGVTEARNWDFFLQAYAAIKGTARPAHYYVVLDEIFRRPAGGGGSGNMRPQLENQVQNTADTVEDLTHNLCYMFGRATKAVSICPPAYYADLACERARCYLSKFFDPDSSETNSMTLSGSSTSGEGKGKDKDPIDPSCSQLRVHDNIKNAMFYI